MNLYIISQLVNSEYDTFDAAIVCCDSEDEAKIIHPNSTHEGIGRKAKDQKWYEPENDKHDLAMETWCLPEHVKVEYLGVASDNVEKGVVLASFNPD